MADVQPTTSDTTAVSAKGAAPPTKKLNPQDIVNEFKQMRAAQQLLVSKVAELEGEQNEHRMVIETLEEIHADGGEGRKCFQLINGILAERTVAEVLPALKDRKERITKLAHSLEEKVREKGDEINTYRDKHNIRFVNEMSGGAEQSKKEDTKSASELSSSKKPESSGILVG